MDGFNGAPDEDGKDPSTEAPRQWFHWVFVPSGVRARRPADALTAGFGALLMLVTTIAADQIQWLESVVVDVVEDIPSWLGGTLLVTWVVGALYALVLIVLVAVQGRRRLGLLVELLIAGGVALVLTAALSFLVSGTGPVVFPDPGDVDGQYPVRRVGVFATDMGLVLAAVARAERLPLRAAAAGGAKGPASPRSQHPLHGFR